MRWWSHLRTMRRLSADISPKVMAKWKFWISWRTFSQKRQKQPRWLVPYPQMQNIQGYIRTNHIQGLRLVLPGCRIVQDQYQCWFLSTRRPLKTGHHQHRSPHHKTSSQKMNLNHPHTICEAQQYKLIQANNSLCCRRSIFPTKNSSHPISLREKIHYECFATWTTQSWNVMLENYWSIATSFVNHIF